MSNKFDNLWVEKYRPKDLDSIILSKTNRDIVSKFYKDKEIPNLLFVGKAGIGKTSLAKILVNDALGCQYLYINASDENGIETIRTKVTNFSRVRSLDGNIKVIILDEVDGLTLDAQRALRNTMEEYSQFTRFILTANYKHKVIPALQSRCQQLDLVPPMDLFVERCKHILSTENIKADDDSINQYIKSFYPDLRRGINELQKGSISGRFVSTETKNNDSLVVALLKLIMTGQVLKGRKLIIQNEEIFNGDYLELMKTLFNAIDEKRIDEAIKKQCLLIVSEYMFRSSFVMDQEINFYSCAIALSKIF